MITQFNLFPITSPQNAFWYLLLKIIQYHLQYLTFLFGLGIFPSVQLFCFFETVTNYKPFYNKLIPNPLNRFSKTV